MSFIAEIRKRAAEADALAEKAKRRRAFVEQYVIHNSHGPEDSPAAVLKALEVYAQVCRAEHYPQNPPETER